LITEDIIVHVVSFRCLHSQYESLGKSTHWLPGVRQFSRYLCHNQR